MLLTAPKRGLVLATIVTACAFGPYVAAGLRTEQLAVYTLAGALVLICLVKMRPSGSLWLVVAAWVSMVVVAIVGVAAPPIHSNVSGSLVAGLDNLVLPLAVLLVVLGLVALGADPLRLVRTVALVTVAGMMINVAAAVAQMRGMTFEAWWQQEDTLESTSMLAAQLGRYGGLINQPAEAGALYGLAMLSTVYLWPARPVRTMLVITVLGLGGLMSVSKVFLWVAIPLTLWSIAKSRRGRHKLGLAMIGAVIIVITARVGFLAGWSGSKQLAAILPSTTDGLVSTLSAGRYGDSATLTGVVDAVRSGPILFGFGARGLRVAYDSGIVEVLVVAGLFGVACHVLVWLALFRAWRTFTLGSERTLFGAVLILLAAADLGLPVLTANRVATVVWMLLGALMLIPKTPGGANASDRRDRQRAPIGRARSSEELVTPVARSRH